LTTKLLNDLNIVLDCFHFIYWF